MSSFVFYIAHYRTNINMNRLFNHCVRSVQTFYPQADIVICESPSIVAKEGYDISGVIWLDNPIPNSACIGCYKDYLQRYKGTNKNAFFIHDTMVLKGRFKEEHLTRPLSFLWTFDCGMQWNQLENDKMKSSAFEFMSKYDMDSTDYCGCFGWSLYANYESIQELWNEIPFEEYMTYEGRGKVMRDLERIIAIVAFGRKLIITQEEATFCGDIGGHPEAFRRAYNGESYEEIQNTPYDAPCVKYWGMRTYSLDNIRECVGISLGWNCAAARGGVTLGLRKRKKEGYKTCPFDIMNSNIPGIIQCIEEDFAHFLDSAYLKLVDIPTTEKYHSADTLIMNTRYGFIFNHESPGHANLYITEQWAGGKEHFVKNDFLEFKKRYSSRIQNFIDYMNSGNTIRFLMNYPHTEYRGIEDCIKKAYPAVSFSFYNTNKDGTDTEIFHAIHKQMGLI
jgi:hypothetical protein